MQGCCWVLIIQVNLETLEFISFSNWYQFLIRLLVCLFFGKEVKAYDSAKQSLFLIFQQSFTQTLLNSANFQNGTVLLKHSLAAMSAVKYTQ